MSDATTTYVAELPPCDLCPPTSSGSLAGYDGATRHGPWAYMCQACFTTHGVGLGLGRGQRLVVEDRPEPEQSFDDRYLD